MKAQKPEIDSRWRLCKKICRSIVGMVRLRTRYSEVFLCDSLRIRYFYITQTPHYKIMLCMYKTIKCVEFLTQEAIYFTLL